MMTKENIITLPNPHLRQRSQRIRTISDPIKKLIAHMRAATLDWEESRPHELGVALAAVQVDRLERIVVIRADFEDKNNRDFVALINPEIIKAEGELMYDHEGCLSVPDVYGLVGRHSKVRIKALGEDGQEIRIKATGFLARVLQHEIDHTNGIMFIDHIKNQDAFFKLTAEGQLNKVPHEQILKRRILW